MIVNTLEQAYGTLADSYQENNKNVMEANRTAAEYNDTMADLGAEIEPVTTAIKKGFTEVVKAGIKMVDADMDEAAEKIGDAFEWIAENMDDVIRIAKGGAAVLGTMFAVNKASQFISSIRNITSVMGLFKIATTGAAAATTAQTAAQEGHLTLQCWLVRRESLRQHWEQQHWQYMRLWKHTKSRKKSCKKKWNRLTD